SGATSALERGDSINAESGALGQRLLRQPGRAPRTAQRRPEYPRTRHCSPHHPYLCRNFTTRRSGNWFAISGHCQGVVPVGGHGRGAYWCQISDAPRKGGHDDPAVLLIATAPIADAGCVPAATDETSGKRNTVVSEIVDGNKE